MKTEKSKLKYLGNRVGKARREKLEDGRTRLGFRIWSDDGWGTTLRFEEGEPRFNLLRPDLLVSASGIMLVDTQTGNWRRYSYSLNDKVKQLCSRLNLSDEEYKELTAAAEEPEWPKNLLQRLRNAEYLLENWYKLPRIP